MTNIEVSNMVKSMGLPYAYYEFPDGTEQALPFICFYFEESDDVFADNANYVSIQRLNIELYTDDRDPEQEAAVESVLTANGLTYHKNYTYIDSEKMSQTLYEMEVIINECE